MEKIKEIKHKIFVYGTLRRGQPLHMYMNKAYYDGFGTLRGHKMYDAGNYPVIVPFYKGVVFGEVYGFEEEESLKNTLRILDMIEQGYSRKLKMVNINGQLKKCFVYVWNHNPKHYLLQEIKSGDYVEWKNKGKCQRNKTA